MLEFAYYDRDGAEVIPNTPEGRSAVASIEARVTTTTTAPLHDGSRPAYSLTMRSYPRNLRLR
jgi:hypothetical protein